MGLLISDHFLFDGLQLWFLCLFQLLFEPLYLRSELVFGLLLHFPLSKPLVQVFLGLFILFLLLESLQFVFASASSLGFFTPTSQLLPESLLFLLGARALATIWLQSLRKLYVED